MIPANLLLQTNTLSFFIVIFGFGMCGESAGRLPWKDGFGSKRSRLAGHAAAPKKILEHQPQFRLWAAQHHV